MALGESVAAALAAQGARGLIQDAARQLAGTGDPDVTAWERRWWSPRGQSRPAIGFARVLRDAGVHAMAMPTISIGAAPGSSRR